jgi:hypothetical protein
MSEPRTGTELLVTRRFSTTPILLAVGLALSATLPRRIEAQQQSPNREQAAQEASPNRSSTSESSGRGTKLMLKDGTFQFVREYKIEGDRVRYYSLDRADWEEIPASLVDWDATKKAATDESQADAALVKKARRQEQERRMMPLGIDASLEVAPGVFLPPGEGVWVFNNKSVLQVPPAEPTYKTNKKREIEKILSPIPIISTRHSVLITGSHAKLRIRTGQPEFYMRTTANSEPDLQLVPAQIEGSQRKIARVDLLFKMEQATTNPLMMQRWQVANDVYRFTLGQTLQPGEYALVEVIPGRTELDQLSIYVWDFGVDAASGESKQAAK